MGAISQNPQDLANRVAVEMENEFLTKRPCVQIVKAVFRLWVFVVGYLSWSDVNLVCVSFCRMPAIGIRPLRYPRVVRKSWTLVLKLPSISGHPNESDHRLRLHSYGELLPLAANSKAGIDAPTQLLHRIALVSLHPRPAHQKLSILP